MKETEDVKGKCSRTYYKVVFEWNKKTNIVEKTYTDFEKLHNHMKNYYTTENFPLFPEKS